MKNNIFIMFVFFLIISCQPITVVEIQEKSKSAYLETITLNSKMVSNFSTDVFNYTLYRHESEGTSITIQATSSDSKSTISGLVNNVELQLNSLNKFTIGVFSEDTTMANFYTINIYLYDDNCVLLKDIIIDGKSIDNFNSELYTYNVKSYSNSVNLSFLPMNSNATINPESISFSFSDNSTDTLNQSVILSASTYTKKYTVVVQKLSSSSGSGMYNGIDLSYELQKDGFSTVIAGDSISVGYSFAGVNINNSSDSYPGLMSWSHMIRDAIHRNDPDFIHADQLQIGAKYSTTSFTKSWANNAAISNSYWMPFNNRNLTISNITKSDEEIVIRIPNNNLYQNKAYLWFSTTPYNVGCSMDIHLNGTILMSDFNLYTIDANYYNGFETKIVEIKNLIPGTNKISLTNFKNTAGGSAMGFFLNGVSSKYSPVYLNGRSSATSDYYVDFDVPNGAFQKRIADKKPDLFIYLIGANDSVNTSGIGNNGLNELGAVKGIVPLAQYELNIRNLVTKVREVNPYSQILLISPPVWSNADGDIADFELNKIIIKEYVEQMKRVAIETNCMFIDMIELFNNIPFTQQATGPQGRDWREDYVHLSKYGNTLLARTIADMLMPQGLYNKEMVDSERLYNEKNNFFIPNNGWIIVKYNNTNGFFDTLTNVFDYSKNYIKSINRVSKSSIMNINVFKTENIGLPHLKVEQFGSNNVEFYTRPESYWDTFQKFWILKNNVSTNYLLTDTDFDTQNMQFLISW